MGLFEKAGEAFEETKQSVLGGSGAEYVCVACEKPVDDDYEYCPHCGEAAVEPVA
jgi:rubrerythrin